MKCKATVELFRKPGVLDPEGQTIAHALASLGYQDVQSVGVGKRIDVSLEAEGLQEAKLRVEDMANRLLANPVLETFRVTVEEA